jgi:hypothetical protein
MATATGTASNRQPNINAALLTVTHSFAVQNYTRGPQMTTYSGCSPLTCGTLNVYGAIAQLFRGIVGVVGSHGYAKNYNYDNRLKYDSPPKFLDPVKSQWQVVTWAEQPAA